MWTITLQLGDVYLPPTILFTFLRKHFNLSFQPKSNGKSPFKVQCPYFLNHRHKPSERKDFCNLFLPKLILGSTIYTILANTPNILNSLFKRNPGAASYSHHLSIICPNFRNITRRNLALSSCTVIFAVDKPVKISKSHAPNAPHTPDIITSPGIPFSQNQNIRFDHISHISKIPLRCKLPT